MKRATLDELRATRVRQTRLLNRFAKHLRGLGKWTNMPDEKNCWCGPHHCIDSVACVEAKKLLRIHSAGEKP